MVLNLDVSPKLHNSVLVKVQIVKDGAKNTVGKLHIPQSMFSALRQALQSRFTVTTTGHF